jgi:very-short-patch-repair endonuclease
VAGARFNRQFPIGPYICDFVSRGERVVIEVDGDTHAHSVESDRIRTRFLESQGYRVIRVWNNDIMENLEGVIERIVQTLANRPSPDPSRKREGGSWGETVRWSRDR